MAVRLWTDEMDDRLVALWRAGKSATAVYRSGLFPGFTRNAIIGRLWRLRKRRGIEQVSYHDKPPAPKPAKKRRKKPNYSPLERDARPPTPVKLPPSPPTARRLPLLQLGPKDCRFIVTHEAKPVHLYCAVDASDFADDYGNNCYCAFHQRMMRAIPARR